MMASESHVFFILMALDYVFFNLKNPPESDGVRMEVGHYFLNVFSNFYEKYIINQL